MSRDEKQSFSEKHDPQATLDPRIREEIENRTTDHFLPCAVAFQICEDLSLSPAEVGKAADLMNYHLVKCQLGLFGYGEKKRIVQPKSPENADMKKAIQNRLKEDRLSCRSAWQVAREFNVPKLAVANACEALGIKIKPCQLGAF
jgi:hypothetical protein